MEGNPMASYIITPDPDETGASIHFPKDRALIDQFKAEFPKARWNREAVAWHVPGVRAKARLEKWAAENVPAERPFEGDRLRDELTTFAPIQSPIAHYLGGTSIVVTTPYDPAIVASLRAIPGAAWNATQKAWFVPVERRAVDALRAALPAIEAKAAEAIAAQQAEKAAREAKWAAEKAKTAQAQAECRSLRDLYPLDDLPPLNTPVRQGPSWIIYTEYGKRFRISEDDPSCFGSHLLGHEGDLGRSPRGSVD